MASIMIHLQTAHRLLQPGGLLFQRVRDPGQYYLGVTAPDSVNLTALPPRKSAGLPISGPKRQRNGTRTLRSSIKSGAKKPIRTFSWVISSTTSPTPPLTKLSTTPFGQRREGRMVPPCPSTTRDGRKASAMTCPSGRRTGGRRSGPLWPGPAVGISTPFPGSRWAATGTIC